MSEGVAADAAAAVKDVGQPAVQATVSAPEVPQEINLTLKSAQPEAPSGVVVATVAAVAPEDVKEIKISAATQSTVTSGSGEGGTKVSSEGDRQPPRKSFQPLPDEFFRSIFYFSGMGRVIGSALAEGVYVDEKNRRNAIDPEEIKVSRDGVKNPGGDLIKTARNQAANLSADFRKLQSILETLPTFTDSVETRSGGGIRVDEPIHGEIYFRSERPDQYQQQQQQQQQRMRQTYIIDPNPLSIPQNGQLIDVPWIYHNSY